MKKFFLLTCVFICACLGGWAQDSGSEGSETPVITVEFEPEATCNDGSWTAYVGSKVKFKVSNLTIDETQTLSYKWGLGNEKGSKIEQEMKSESCIINDDGYICISEGTPLEIELKDPSEFPYVLMLTVESEETPQNYFSERIHVIAKLPTTIEFGGEWVEKYNYNILGGKKIEVTFTLKDENEELLNPKDYEITCTVEPNSGDKPTIEIREEGGVIIYTPNNETEAIQVIIITLKVTANEGEITEPKSFIVHPNPKVDPEKNTEDDPLSEAELTIETKGGNDPGWDVTYTVDDPEGELAAAIYDEEQKKWKLDLSNYKDGIVHCLFVTVKNSYDNNEWYNETFKYYFKIEESQPSSITVDFKKDHDYDNIFEDDTVKLSFDLKDDNGRDVSKDGYTWHWDDKPGESNETYSYVGKYENGQPHEIGFKLFKDGSPVDYTTDKKPEFTVYQIPIPKYEIDGESENLRDGTIDIPVSEDQCTITIVPEGGYEEGWTYSWTNDTNNQSGSSGSFEVNKSDGNEQTIELTLTNQLPEPGSEWEKTYQFIVTFVGGEGDDMPKITLEKTPNVTHVFNGKSVEISLKLDGQDPDNALYEWTWNNGSNNENSFTFNAQTDKTEGSESKEVTLSLTRKEDAKQKAKQVEFTVWSTPMPKYRENVLDNNKVYPETVTPETPWEIIIEPYGGNPDGWKYEWKEKGEIILSSSYKIEYVEGKTERDIELTVTNRVPGNDDNESTGIWKETYKFKAIFKNDDNPYTIAISTPYTENSRGLYILQEDSTAINVVVKKGDEEIGLDELEAEGLSLTWDCKDGGKVDSKPESYVYTAEYKGDKNNPGKPFDNIIIFYLENDVEIISSDTLIFHVYPTPSATPVNTLFENVDKTVTLEVNTKGGNPNGWKYYWNTEAGKSTYPVEYDSEKDSLIVSLRVTNGSSDNPPYVWYDQTFEYTIKFKPATPTIAVELVLNPDFIDLLPDKRVTITAKTAEEDVQFKWYDKIEPDKQLSSNKDCAFTAGANDTKEAITKTIVVEVSKEGFETCIKDTTFTIWPKPTPDDSWTIESLELVDKDNDKNDLKKGIRSENTLQLPENCNPQTMVSGHTWGGYEWTYEWYLNGQVISSDAIIVKADGDKPVVQKIVCKAKYKKGNDVMWEGEIGSRSITVYPKPATPNYFVQKGNGTSLTWIVGGYKEQGSLSLNVGSLIGTESVIIKRNVSMNEAGDLYWFHLESNHKDDKSLFVYVEKDFGDNVHITSDLLKVGGSSSTPWDGSTYNVDNLNISENAPIVSPVGMYSISGAKTNTMVRGLNIIRLEDGTVKKVLMK